MKTFMIATAVLLTGTAVAAQDAQPQEESQPEKKICRTERVTGSLTRRTRICMTEQQWRDLHARTKRSMDEMQSPQGGGVQPNNMGLGGPGI